MTGQLISFCHSNVISRPEFEGNDANNNHLPVKGFKGTNIADNGNTTPIIQY